MAFYCYVEQIGNQICHRYVDDKGVSHSEVIREYPIELYVKGRKKNDSSRGLHDEVLNKIEFTSIADAKEFHYQYRDMQEIHGQTNFALQYIAYKYPEEVIGFDFSKVNILIVDIETAFDEQGFPTPEKANQEILSITCKLLGKDNPFVVFGMKEWNGDVEDTEYHGCSNEKELLVEFQKHFIHTNLDIIVGWNSEWFDIPYIINRSIRVCGEEFTRRFSPFHQQIKNCIIKREKGKDITYDIVGITSLDYLDLYKKYSSSRLESYRLDVVGQHELGEGKVDFSEYKNLMDLYNRDFNRFIEYNIHDVRLVVNLENKLKFLFLALTIAYLGKIRYDEIHSQVKFWDTYIYNALLRKGIQIPPHKKETPKEIVGAYVKDPQIGKYEWIVTLDLTSLYPSIIMSFNMSPETQMGAACYGMGELEKFIGLQIDTSHLKSKDLTMLANGATFRRDKQGIMPELVVKTFADRKQYKGRAIEYSKEVERLKEACLVLPEEESFLLLVEREEKENKSVALYAMELALKIAMNSLYGATANQYFRYYNTDIAEGITITGQLVIRYISDRLNVRMNELFRTKGVDYIVFNDTDSAGLNFQHLIDRVFTQEDDPQKIVDFLDKFVKRYIDPFIADEFKKLADYLNVYENRLFMKREVIADRALFRAKKNYVLQVYDKEGIRYQHPYLKMVGIETAKSSTPQIVRGSLEQAISIILNYDEDRLQQFVKTFRSLFFQATNEQIAFPRGVSDIDKWVTETGMKKGSPIHVRGSLLYNALLRKHRLTSDYPLIKNGDKIKFLYLKVPNPTQSNVIAFLDVIPAVFGLEKYIDRETQFSKTFMEPLGSFTEIVKWNVEKQSSLSDFFN